jgi:hypothetical protein
MSLLAPAALFLAALAIPIIILYMLKLRRRDLEISSTFLWQMVIRDRQANAPWQRLRRNLLLFLQLLILAALIFALARPVLPVPTVASGAVIVLLDASASMQASDVGGSRFEVAKDQVSALINDLDPNSIMTLILVGEQPQILAAGESQKTSLRAALAPAQVEAGEADWAGAISLATGAAGTQQFETTVVIVSDGGLPETGLPPLPVTARYLPIGESADNLAITALAVRPGPDPAGGTLLTAQLFARVTNYGRQNRLANFNLTVDGAQELNDQISIEAGGSINLVLESLPNRPVIIRAQLSNLQETQALDDFALDDTAFAFYQPPVNRNTLLVSEGNIFLEQILTLMPNITPFKAVPAEDGSLTIPQDPFGLYVFDGILPSEIPNADLLVINPPGNPLFEVAGMTESFTNPTVSPHPLTEFIDWSSIHIQRTRLVEAPPWADVLVRTEETPLVFAGEIGGRRVAVVSFDLHDSDLPLQVTFPVLFSSLIDFLTPAQSVDVPAGLQPGQPVRISIPTGVDGLVVIDPLGEVFPLNVVEGEAQFTDTNGLGLYAVNFLDGDQQLTEYFAINLFSPVESQIAPAESLNISQTGVLRESSTDLGQREYWPWLAGAALLILGIEWWAYHRRAGSLGSVWRGLRVGRERAG